MMRWLKILVTLIGFMLVSTIVLPLIGPWLGLASFQALVEPPGQRVEVSAGPLNVYMLGSGRDVVLVHGHPGSAQMMAPLAGSLAKLGYRVVRYDRMGWGHSGQRSSRQPANPRAHAQDLLDLVQALELKDPIFVGYSYGGGVVQEVLRLEADNEHVAVLISSVGMRKPLAEPSIVGKVLFSPFGIRWALGTDYTAMMVGGAISEQIFQPENAPEMATKALLASLALPNVPTQWRREADERYVGFEDYRPASVSGCVRILHGDGDKVVSADIALYLHQAILNSTLGFVQDAGHGMVVTQPDRLARQVTSHLQHCSR